MVKITPSIGIALARPGVQTAERLIRRLHAGALYRAKAAGRATYALATVTGDLAARRHPAPPFPPAHPPP